MTTPNPEPGLDNVFLLALITSASLHLAALYSRVDWFAIPPAPATAVDNVAPAVEIPIEFIPQRAQAVTQTTMPGEIVRSIVEEAKQKGAESGLTNQRTGHYSFVRRQALMKRYLSEVREEIETHKYAAVSNRRALVGNVTISFKILSDGSFRGANVIGTSGFAVLDRAGLVAVEMSSGKVKRSQVTGSRSITTTVVIKYQYGL